MMTCIAVQCFHGHHDQMVKRGKPARGTQRYLCQYRECTTDRFLLDYRNRGCSPGVKQLIIDMQLHASGIRNTARSLRINTDTVLSKLKKKVPSLASVNTEPLHRSSRRGDRGHCAPW